MLHESCGVSSDADIASVEFHVLDSDHLTVETLNLFLSVPFSKNDVIVQ